MDVADVGVVEGRRGPSLVDEPLPRFGIGRPLRREKFESYGTLKEPVKSPWAGVRIVFVKESMGGLSWPRSAAQLPQNRDVSGLSA
jgi:hypothetical protein